MSRAGAEVAGLLFVNRSPWISWAGEQTFSSFLQKAQPALSSAVAVLIIFFFF